MNWFVLLAASTIHLCINAHRHESSLYSDKTLCLRKGKAYMKHCFEHYLGVRAWSIGTYCSSRLNVMTSTELIHTVKHTVLHLYPLYPLPVVCGGQCHIFWPLLSVTSYPCLAPGTHTTDRRPWVRVCHWQWLEIHLCLWKDEAEWGDRYICCGSTLLSEQTSRPHWFNTLLHCPSSPILSHRRLYHIYFILSHFKGLYHCRFNQ